MEEQLVSYETARLAKEKGFKESMNNCYDPECFEVNHVFKYWDEYFCSTENRRKRLLNAPTQALLQRWFREVHGIEVFVKPFYIPQLSREGCFKYYGLVVLKDCVSDCNALSECKDKYEDAFEDALKLAFKSI
jgi:hypothetical protein